MENEGTDLAGAIGAVENVLGQMLSLYIPSKDGVTDEEFDNRQWVAEATDVLVRIGGGYTVTAPALGGYLKRDGTVVQETVTIIYTYVKPDLFEAELPRLREFLHRMGRDTRQEMVVMEFVGMDEMSFFQITEFDSASRKEQ